VTSTAVRGSRLFNSMPSQATRGFSNVPARLSTGESGSPYGSSEVIHDLGPKPELEALERERHQIVNNFAVSASAGYELAPPPQ
jgi:hypothetical protein